MSGQTRTLFAVICDGCGDEHEAEPGVAAEKVRRDLAEQGWQIVPLIKASGAPYLINWQARFCDDVCPTCAPTWTPRTKGARDRFAWVNDPEALRRRAELIEGREG